MSVVIHVRTGTNLDGALKREPYTVAELSDIPAVCPDPMTRAALLALRSSGSLDPNCHYVITDPNADGNLDAQEIILHAVNTGALSMQAGILTSHDSTAWQGVYDIDAANVIEVVDNLENRVLGNGAINNFPFGNNNVTNNTVEHATLTVTGGTVTGNNIKGSSNVTVSAGTFANNTVGSDANVISAAITTRNTFDAQSDSTINTGDFRENTVKNNATVTSNTTGDVDNNIFGAASDTVISGTANFDLNTIKSDANVTVTGGTVLGNEFWQLSDTVVNGGTLSDTTVGEDAQVTINSGLNYENKFGNSTIYNQVGTGYIRYTTIEGTTTWTNGNTDVSNVRSYVSSVDTTGSTGTISNCDFHRATATTMQNIASLTITDTSIKDYSQISANNAARLYLYRSSVNGGSRVLVSAGSRIDASYTNLDSYSYLQSTQIGGFLRANYCNLTSLSYIRNTTVNQNFAEGCSANAQSSIRFDGTVSNCRVYYSSADGGAAIYHTGSSNDCYMYYCSADGLGQIYSQNSVSARLYYNTASARAYVRSLDCATTHYIYYSTASSSSYIQMSASQGRLYSIEASSQSIFEKRGNNNSNLYYSSVRVYYYYYITLTAGTISGIFGEGRRTQVLTNPVTVAPYGAGAAWQNI
jgi:hypothetical protein